MNCACAVVTNNSILRAGARRERESATQPFPHALLTGEHGAVGRRRGAARTEAPSPTPPALPSVRPSGRSVDQLAERRDSRMPGLRPTGLPHFALSIPLATLSRTSTFHFETFMLVRSHPTNPLPYAENGRRRKPVARHG